MTRSPASVLLFGMVRVSSNRLMSRQRSDLISQPRMVVLRARIVAGRYLASVLGVHESTISRDLAFIAKVKADYRRTNWGAEMHANSFRWIENARGYETVFHYQDGVRLK